MNSTSSGSTASLIAAACAIISWSMPRRPAVSMITMLCSVRRASSIDCRATATGSPTLLPDHLQLVHGVRPLQVGGDEHRRVALLLQPQCELARQRGLT